MKGKSKGITEAESDQEDLKADEFAYVRSFGLQYMLLSTLIYIYIKHIVLKVYNIDLKVKVGD